MKARLGILGGTFDPVHRGHIDLALEARREASLDQVLLMPAYIQPFKQDRKTASPEARKAMLDLAVDGLSGLAVSTYELMRGQVSYTYDTIDALRTQEPDKDFFFIMGSDSYFRLESWYKGIDLLQAVSYIVGARAGDQRERIREKAREYRKKYGAKTLLLKKDLIKVSSTDIRTRIREGRSVRGLVDTRVEAYIYEQGLYL